MEGGDDVVTKAKISRGETALVNELARIGVNASKENAQGVVSFAAEIIDKRADTPPGWRRNFRRLAAHAIAARVPSMAKGKEKRAHLIEVGKRMAWLAKRGVSDDELKKLSLDIADRMIGE